jgi:hypothetical protein
MRTSRGPDTRIAPARPSALLLGALLSVALLAGCSTTRITDHWRDPAWNEPPLHNVLIMVVRKDPARRRIWEDAWVDALHKHGITATPSYRSFPDEVPSEDAIDDVMRNTNYDGIILSRNLGSREYLHYVPPSYVTYPVGHRWGGFYGRYHTYWGTSVTPGYVEPEVVVHNEITVWDARADGKMVWSGTASTSNPTSVDQLSNSLTKEVVSKLARDAILP